jgi:glucose-6-phosphate 1-dehydrogenase
MTAGTFESNLFVIFGATGDLTARKLLPALYRLVERKDEKVVILGAATSDLDDDSFRDLVHDGLVAAGLDPVRSEAWCRDRVHYQPLSRDGYGGLATRIGELEARHDLPGNRVHYLALPPQIFPTAIGNLGAAGLNRSPGWTRLVVEKPFGRDLASARALNGQVHRHFDESQVYRIDHYLGKETVQNLLVFRFTNPIFEASWNRDRIARVEITVAESLGIGSRGGYYDAAGVVRDMIQNHLAQVLSLIAMESPVGLAAEAIRAEKIKVLHSIPAVPDDNVVLGQYSAGTVDGREVPAYRSLEGVDPDSTTATYAAIRLHVDNWRWQGVPFVVRTGKAMAQRTTQIAVTFRPPPICLFHACADGCLDHSDVLTLTLQPDEGFRLDIEVKQPGDAGDVRTIPLRFDYAEEFGEIPEAYETLLRDVIQGDQTLFVHADEVEESWRLFTPIVAADHPVHEYPAGSWGPDEARRLLDGSPWAVGT